MGLKRNVIILVLIERGVNTDVSLKDTSKISGARIRDAKIFRMISNWSPWFIQNYFRESRVK